MPRGRRRPWALWIYGLVTAGCMAGAVAATARIQTLERSTHWVEDQVASRARDYATTLQGRYVDDEMANLRERRGLLASAATWWQLRLACLMLWVLASFAFYIQRAVASLSEELLD